MEIVQGLHESGMYARVLGNVAYVMVSPTTLPEVCIDLMSIVKRVIQGLDGRPTPSEPEAIANIV